MITKDGKKMPAKVFAVLLCFLLLASQGIVTYATNGAVYGSGDSEQKMPEENGQEPEAAEPPKSIIELQYGDHYQDYEEYTDLYIMTDVSHHVYTIGSGENLTIQCSGELKYFSSVQVDDILVDPGNYYLDEGSTILTFVAKYLDTLSVGKHSVTMNYTYDSIDTELTILGRADAPVDNQGGVVDGMQGNVSNTISGEYGSGKTVAVKTGDETAVGAWALAMAAALGSCVVLGVRKRTV